MYKGVRVQKTGNGNLRISGKCVSCEKSHFIEKVSEDGFNMHKRDIQLAIALPEIKLDDAMFITQGLCPNCQGAVGNMVEVDACHNI